MNASYPLDETHLQKINQALDHCANARRVIERCQRAKLPVEGPASDEQMLREQLEAVKQEFFVVRP